MRATEKPICTSCGKAEATVYYGAYERLCGDCYNEPPKEITVYVGGAIGSKRWWWNSSAGGEEFVYVRKEPAAPVKRRNGRGWWGRAWSVRPASLWTYGLACGHSVKRVGVGGNHAFPSADVKCNVCKR